MMISRGVEISIAGGGEEMVRGLSLGRNQAPYIGIHQQKKVSLRYLHFSASCIFWLRSKRRFF